MYKMIKAEEVPWTWTEHMHEHMHNLAMMACEWDWCTCRLWSERIFDMIDDGRLPHAWSDHYAVKDIQRDAYAVGSRIAQPKRANGSRHAQTAPTATHSNAHTTASGNHDGRQEFNRETDGKPCSPWNWGSECGFNASHGEGQEKKVHVCAWCANKNRRANVHKEKECLNKKRFLEKKAAQSTDNNGQSAQVF